MWQLTRQDTKQTLQLHPQYTWADEYDWTPLAQSDPAYLLNGAIDIQQGTKQAGRPITLNGDKARITRGDVKTLQTWASVPELTFTLTHPNGDEYQVIFKRPFINNIKEIKPYRPSDQSDKDTMTADIYFITV